MSLKGKVAIVTGAGGGVGRSTTERLVKEGCRVTLVGRDRSKLARVISDNDSSNNLLAVSADIIKEAEVLNVIGDVKGKTAVLVDDMIDTAGTISEGARLLRREGARQVYACATHAVFSPPAIERLSSGLFEEVIVTNTIPVAPDKQFEQLTILSVANLLGETIWRIHEDSSVSSMFR